MTSTLLLIYSLWIGVRNISYVCVVGIFRAGGDTKIGMFLDIGALFLLSIPIVTTLGFLTDVPFYVLIIAMYIAEDTPKSVLCLIRFKSRKLDKAADRRGLRAAGSRRGSGDRDRGSGRAEKLSAVKYNHKSKRPRRVKSTGGVTYLGENRGGGIVLYFIFRSARR